MTVEADGYSGARRRLILRDSVTFFSLIAVTGVLFAITLFLFRSFEGHRNDLALLWSDRGRRALQEGHPQDAIVDLRTALSYTPDERSYELLLAQALGDAGRIEESYNYFLGLWETKPGDGLINLSLARLTARKNDNQAAINYYRASIYGTWEGDGIVRRREVRLELARYLIAHHDTAAARSELLVAAGNSPGDVSLELIFAQLLEEAGAPGDALIYYKKALAQEPKNEAAMMAAGRLEYENGDFEEANRLLSEATNERKSAGVDSGRIEAMREDSARIVALAPLKSLPASERAARIVKARLAAKRRFDECNAQIATTSGLASPLHDLASRWIGKEGVAGRAALAEDPEEQDAVMQLIFDTETQTSKICGAPVGDDALLLLMAKHPNAMEQ